MVRAMITLAVSSVVSLMAFSAVAQVSQLRAREGKDSFLYAPPENTGGRVSNYVADSVRNQPLDYSDRRRIQRPPLLDRREGFRFQSR